MNREIKFRAWDRNERLKNRMIYNPSLNSAYFQQETLKGIEIMQFTGLKDKNGKEIYEGDIVEFPDGIGEIEMRDGCWKSCYNGKNDRARNRPDTLADILFDEEYGDNQVEIIGNIYENPDLLKEDK